MTACTDAYGCTATDCAPCTTAGAWSSAGWIGQGALLLIGVALAVLGARGAALQVVRPAAWSLGPLAIALMAGTVLLAVRSS